MLHISYYQNNGILTNHSNDRIFFLKITYVKLFEAFFEAKGYSSGVDDMLRKIYMQEED